MVVGEKYILFLFHSLYHKTSGEVDFNTINGIGTKEIVCYGTTYILLQGCIWIGFTVTA